MRTVVDTAPRCRGPAHADRGMHCGCVDQETLTIGTRLITAKERSLWFAELAPLSASQASSPSTTWTTSARLQLRAHADDPTGDRGERPRWGWSSPLSRPSRIMTAPTPVVTTASSGMSAVTLLARSGLPGAPLRPSCRSDRRSTASPRQDRLLRAMTRPRRARGRCRATPTPSERGLLFALRRMRPTSGRIIRRDGA
jgi:hypothetical protein